MVSHVAYILFQSSFFLFRFSSVFLVSTHGFSTHNLSAKVFTIHIL
jgi:hypothetical protein